MVQKPRAKRHFFRIPPEGGIEVLVKAEHDFYREKWRKEQNKRSGFISHVIRCDAL
jgi:hypothetical protein